MTRVFRIYYAHCRVWDRELGCEVASLPHEDVVNSVAFCPRDEELMVSIRWAWSS